MDKLLVSPARLLRITSLTPYSVWIYRVTMQIENGMSSTKAVERAALRTEDWLVKDLKFVDDEDVILAVSNES